jgi:threonine/homoserine/homoserine lactone efflux protein
MKHSVLIENDGVVFLLSVVINGLITGMILQLAIGPIFLYVAGLTIEQSAAEGFAAVLAVTLVDFLFIVCAIMGVGRLLEREKIKKMMGIGSSLVLCYFGFMMFRDSIGTGAITALAVSSFQGSVFSSFTKAFILTASSPLTVIFWTGIFTARSIEKGFNRKQLWVFGLAAGTTTPLFLGGSVLVFSALRSSISFAFAGTLNMIVGIILMLYGVIRLFKFAKSSSSEIKPVA